MQCIRLLDFRANCKGGMVNSEANCQIWVMYDDEKVDDIFG